MAKDPKAIPEEARSALVEAEALIGKCDDTRGRIRESACTMMQEYDAAIEQVENDLIAQGIGTSPELEKRLEKLLRSRNACARAHGGSRSE